MIKTTTWTAPCGCKISYDWNSDRDLEVDGDTHHRFRTQVTCPRHHGLSCKDRYDTLIAESAAAQSNG